MQGDKPIAFYHRILGIRARDKSIYEEELMAICLAIQKWQDCLLGRRFIIRTDQQSLRFITQQREIGADFQKWVRKLIGFDFNIQYKPGVSNRVVDALFKMGEGEVEFGALVSVPGVNWGDIDADV